MEKTLFKSKSSESFRMFKSDFFEFFSRCAWYVPLIYWGILVSIALTIIIKSDYLTNTLLWKYLGIGFFVWSILEYTIHRFVFHWKPSESNKLGQRLHFLMHGVHHDYPNDKFRLVTPPALSTILGIPVLGIYYLCLADWYTAITLFCGSAIGFVLYDLLHYYFHHGNIKTKWIKKLQSDHLRHHYTDDDKNFGVSPLGVFWDYIFKTNK